MGGVIGLAYEGCEAVLRPFGLWDPEVIGGLRMIEQEFVGWAAERAEAAANQSAARHGRKGLL